MKKLWIVLLSLFLLTGCGQKPETPVPPSDPSPTQQEPNEPPVSPEPETPARAEQVDLTFFVEGEEEALPATLYVGDGYSLYIPDEDWDGPEQSTENGVPTDTWVSAFNSDVALSVSRYSASVFCRTVEMRLGPKVPEAPSLAFALGWWSSR